MGVFWRASKTKNHLAKRCNYLLSAALSLNKDAFRIYPKNQNLNRKLLNRGKM